MQTNQQCLYDSANIKLKYTTLFHFIKVSSELRSQYEELQRRTVPTKDASVQCDSNPRDMKSKLC